MVNGIIWLEKSGGNGKIWKASRCVSERDAKKRGTNAPLPFPGYSAVAGFVSAVGTVPIAWNLAVFFS